MELKSSKINDMEIGKAISVLNFEDLDDFFIDWFH